MYSGEEDMVIFDIGLSFGIGALFKSVEKRRSLLRHRSQQPHLASRQLPGILAPLSGLGLTVPHSQRGATTMVCGVFVFTLVGASLAGYLLQAKWKQTGFVLGVCTVSIVFGV